MSMSNTNYDQPVQQLTGQLLDFWMYQHAARVLGKEASVSAFEAGYQQGLYHFLDDQALLAELIEKFQIRVQLLGGEWLASTEDASQYGERPIEAVCRLIVANTFGLNPSL